MIILKFTKKQGFTLSLQDTFFKKPEGGGMRGGGGESQIIVCFKNLVPAKICISTVHYHR